MSSFKCLRSCFNAVPSDAEPDSFDSMVSVGLGGMATFVGALPSSAISTREEAAAAGGAMSNAKMVCGVSLLYLVRGS